MSQTTGTEPSGLEALEALEVAIDGDATPEPARVAMLIEGAGQLVESVWDRDDVQGIRVRLLALVDRLLELEMRPAVRGPLLERRARLLEQLGDPEEAARVLVESFRALPSDEPLASLDAAAGLSAGREDAVLHLFSQLTEDPARRAGVERRRGLRYIEKQQYDEAEQALSAALALEPEDETALLAIGRLDSLRVAGAQRLDDLRASARSAATGEARARAFVALAEALLTTDTASVEALAALTDAWGADPTDVALARRVVPLLVRAGSLATIATLGAVHVQAVAAPSRSSAAKLVGLALAEAPAHAVIASDLLRTALVADAADPETVDALDRIATTADQPAELRRARVDGLREVLAAARRATKSRPDERRWLVREGELLWRDLGDMEEAEKVFRRVRAADPRDMVALAFFEDDLTRRADWKRLHAVLAQKLAIVPKEQRVAVALEMAHLSEEQLGSAEMAVEAYKRVLTEEPAHEVASQKLLSLYRTTGKWHALIELLNGRIRRLGDSADDAEKKVALLFQIIDIYQDPEKLRVEEMVIQTYNRIVQISPSNVAALDSLAQRYEDSARWSELVQVLQKKIAATSDEDQLLDLFHHVADLYLSKMSSESQAIPFLERILELDPSNLDVVRRLRDIYKSKHNLERLYATYMAELELTEPGRREAILNELAVLATDKLHWNEEAIRHWEALLDLSPRNEKAVTSLAQLYAEEGEWQKYATLLESRLDHAKTRKRRAELLEKLAEIRWDRLGLGAEAKAAYREVLEIQPGHPPARTGLQRIFVAEKAWDDLKAFYAEQSDWTGYVAFLDEHLGGLSDKALRTDIHLEIVRVLEAHLNDRTRAIDRLVRVLADDPDNLPTARALADRYDAAGDVNKLLPVLKRAAELSTNPRDAMAALTRAVVALQRVSRDREAFEWALRVADVAVANGTLGEAVDSLDARAESADALPSLGEWYLQAETRVGGVPERLELLRRRAVLLRDRLRRPAEAVRSFEAMLELDGGQGLAGGQWDTITALEELAYREQSWPAYERVLSRRIDALETEGDVDKLRLALMRLGRLHEEILEQPGLAVDAYRRILDRLPGDEEAVEGLTRVYEAEGRWDDLVGLLDAERMRSGSHSVRAELDARAARVLVGRLGRADDALTRIERSLATVADNDPAVLLLWELFENDISRDGVIDLIEPVLRRQRETTRLREVLVARVRREVDLTTLEALHREIAELSQTPEEAFPHRMAEFALAPGEPAPRAALEALASELGRFEPVARLYALVLGIDTDSGDEITPSAELVDRFVRLDDVGSEATLTRRLAEIYEAHLGDVDRATACAERVLGFDPDSLDTLAALERLHARREDWEGLLAVYRRKAALVWDVDEKRSVYHETCRLLRDELGRPEESVEVYESILMLDENDPEAIAELDGLYTEYQRWDDLVALLRRRLTRAAAGDERSKVHLRLAQLFSGRLGAPDKAIDEYVAVLSESVDAEAALAALDVLLDADHLAEWEALAGRICDVLQPRFRDSGEWQREVRLLTVRARLAATDRDRGTFLRLAGERFEHRGDDFDGAFDAYSEAFRLFPEDTAAEAGLGRAAEALGRYGEWADALGEAAPLALPTTAIRFLIRLGTIASERLADPARAMDAYERVLVLDPHDATALASLDSLYASDGKDRDRVAILERRADATADDVERRQMLVEAGSLREALGETGEATDAYELVLASGDPVAEPTVMHALDRVIALYDADGAHEPLVAALRRKADALAGRGDTFDEIKVWLFRAAEVLEVGLSDPKAAIELYERVRSSDPTDSTAFENLRRLFADAGRWEDLEGLLIDARARTQDARLANVTDYMLAQLYDNELGRAGDALDRYEAILDRTTAFPAARRALEEALDRPEEGARVADILERHYTAVDDVAALVALLEQRLMRWPKDDAVGVRRRLAAIREQRLNDPVAAFEDLRYAGLIEWSSTSGLRSELVRLAALTGLWDDLEILDREVLEATKDSDLRLDILTEMTRVARDERQDLDVAEGILKETLADFPDHQPTVDLLLALYEATGRTREVVDILRHEVEHTADRTTRIALLYRMAELQRDRLEDVAAASDTFDRILREDPRERRAYRALEAALVADEDHLGVIALLRREIAVVDSAEDRVETRRRIAVLVAEHATDRDDVVLEADELLRLEPTSTVAQAVLERLHAERHAAEKVFCRLEALYERQGAWDHVVRLHQEGLVDQEVPGQISSLDRIRTVQLTHQQDRAAAYETEKTIVRLAPGDRRRWDSLEDAASRLSQLADFVAFAFGALDDGLGGLDVALRAARVAEERLKSETDAVAAHRRALDLSPTCDPAIAALRRIFRASERWADLAQLEEHTIAHVLTGRDREKAWLSLGALKKDKLGDLVGAADALERVLDASPQSSEAFARLEAIHRERDAWDDVEATLHRWSEVAVGDELATVRFRLAVLLLEQRVDRDGALDVAARVLAARQGSGAPAHAPTVRLVEDILGTADDAMTKARAADLLEVVYSPDAPWRRWEAVYRAQLSAASDPGHRMLLHLHLGQLYQDRGAEPNRALQEFGAAFALEYGSAELEATIEAVARAHGLWTELADIYLAGLDEAPSSTVLARYLRRLGEIYQGALRDADTAVMFFERLIEIEPGDVKTLGVLEAYYESKGPPQNLVRVLALRLDATTEDTARIALLYRLADLYRTTVSEPQRAVATWRSVLDVDPSEARAKDRLEAYFREQGDFESLVDVFRAKLDYADDPDDRLEILTDLARVQERELGRLEDAVATYQETRLLAPQNILALTSLERLYPRIGDWAGMLTILESKRASFADPRARAEADFQIGALLVDRLDAPERAMDGFRLALQQFPLHEATIRYLERLQDDPRVAMEASRLLEPIYLQAESWKPLERTLGLELDQTADLLDRIELLRRLAEIRDRELDDADGALDALGMAFALDPTDTTVRDLLSEVADRSERWAALADILRRALSGPMEPPLARDLNVWLAEVAEQRLEDVEASIEAWRAVLAYDELDPRALAELGRLLEHIGRYSERVDILRREVDTASGGDARTLKKHLAHLLAVTLDDSEGAFDLYKELLFEDPSDEECVEALDRLGQRHTHLADAVSRALIPVYEAAGRWRDVVRLDLQSTEGASSQVRSQLFERIASVYEQHLEDPDQAYSYYRQALDERPDRLDMLAKIASLAERSGRLDDLMAIYQALSAQADAPDLRRELLLRAGALAQGPLRRSDVAERCYREVLDLDAESYEALSALMGLYEAQQRLHDFLDVGEQLVNLSIALAEKRAALEQMARFATQWGDVARAEETWRRLLDLDGGNLGALTALESIYRTVQSWAPLVDILEQRASVESEPTVLSTLKVELGRIRGRMLGDPDGAIDAFEEAIDLDPTCEEALSELEALYTENEVPADLARILTRRLELANHSADRLRILHRLAVIAEKDLDDADMAVDRYESILVIEPNHPVALDALIRLHEGAERWDRLAAMVEQRAGNAKNAVDAIALLLRAAELNERKLDNADHAKDLLGRVLELDPNHRGALSARAHLFEHSGDTEHAIEAYEALVKRSEDPEARVAAQLTLGRLYLYGKDATGKALQIFKDVLLSRPDHPEATQRLKEVLYRRESWEALAPVIEREVEQAEAQGLEPRALAELYLELATVLGERLRNADGAYRWLRKGIELKRDHPGIVASLIEQHLARKQNAEALPLLAWYTNWLEAKRKFPELAVASARLASLYEEKKDLERAYAAYQVASQADSRSVAVQLGLGRLAYETGRLDKALQTLQGLLLVQHEFDDDSTRVQLFLTLARVCLDSGDKAKAKRHVARLLALDPTHADALVLQRKLG